MAQKRKGLSSGEKAAIGAAVTAAGLAALGGYFLYGAKDAAKNRKKVKSRSLKAKAEVLEGLEKAKKMTKAEYEELVDGVTKGYRGVRAVGAQELSAFSKELKGHWKAIEKSGTARAKKAARKAKPKK